MLRVAFDVTALHDARTGVGVVTQELLTRLAARDRVEVIAYSVSWRGRRQIAGLVPEGVRVVKRPMAARPMRQAWRRMSFPPIEWWTGEVDVVFGPNFVVPPARWAARVALVHDLTAWRFPQLCTADTRQYPGLVGRAVATGAHVITPSQAVAEEVVSIVGARPDRVHPVHWGAVHGAIGDRAAGRWTAGAERYVLSLGTIEPRKDHALLVEAFDKAAARDTTLHLVVVGQNGWGVDRYNAAVATAVHRDRIIRLGYVDDFTRADLVASATVFAYPSVYEGFGLPPLEALAAGIPVVATAAGALPEVLGDSAFLVPPGDGRALTNALAAAAGLDNDARMRVAEKGRRQAAKFSWEKAADGVFAALTAAVTEHRTIPRRKR